AMKRIDLAKSGVESAGLTGRFAAKQDQLGSSRQGQLRPAKDSDFFSLFHEFSRPAVDLGRLDDFEHRPRSVMTLQPAAAAGGAGLGGRQFDVQFRFDLFPRDGSRPQYDGKLSRAIDNRAFEADFAAAAVENQRRARAEFLSNMLCLCGTDLAEAIGGRSRNCPAELAEQCLGDRMTRDPKADGREPASDHVSSS